MDPFSAEGELINLHNHFIQGQWQAVIDYDTSALSAENALPARVLALRAQVALGHAEDVVAEVQGEKEAELAAVGAFAEYVAGNKTEAVKTAEKLAAAEGENGTVQVMCGRVLQAAGMTEEALALLSKHQGSRKEFYTLLVPITDGWQLRLLRSLFKYIYNKIEQIWHSKRFKLRDGGLKTVYLST
jgi:coatomer protein complex subunit epsilon